MNRASDFYRKADEVDATLKAIDDFVQKRKAKGTGAEQRREMKGFPNESGTN